MDKFTIQFTIDELRVIDQALQNMPYKYAASVINTINIQIEDQRRLEDSSGSNESV